MYLIKKSTIFDKNIKSEINLKTEILWKRQIWQKSQIWQKCQIWQKIWFEKNLNFEKDVNFHCILHLPHLPSSTFGITIFLYQKEILRKLKENRIYFGIATVVIWMQLHGGNFSCNIAGGSQWKVKFSYFLSFQQKFSFLSSGHASVSSIAPTRVYW